MAFTLLSVREEAIIFYMGVEEGTFLSLQAVCSSYALMVLVHCNVIYELCTLRNSPGPGLA